MKSTAQNALLGLDLKELTAIVENSGQASFRARQLLEAIYRQRVDSLGQISTLPQGYREELGRAFSLGLPEVDKTFVSSDGTIRYLMRFGDGQTVETVWMPEGDGGEAGDGSELMAGSPSDRLWDRATICVSSQVGCAVDCQFCLTAQLGIKRNLTAGEIVGQVCAVLKHRGVSPPNDRINLVFMGMGEPFLNFENFIKGVRLLVDAVGIPESRMTVSTAGIVPRIYDLGNEPIRPKLAISLNASNDETRTRLMPINRKWDLEKLVRAAGDFPLRHREKLTFEYVLLDGVNDSPANARELVNLITGIRAKVNLIAWNPGPGIAFGTPSPQQVAQFQEALIKSGIPAFVRRPRGRDIYAACGQLKRTEELTAIA
jgi:23S rRNA (adenine2503-C2)-methyltransferase